MYISLYDYKDYKKFINDWIRLMPNKGRGQKIHLAEALRCQTPFISHVLSGDYHFSLEQSIDCAKWLALNDEETEYFLQMVFKAKAGTKEAETFFDRQLNKKKTIENDLKKRLKLKEDLSPEDQNQYYTSWHYSAIHMALMNPRLQSLAALQSHFQLPTMTISKIIDFLIKTNLVTTDKNGKLKNTSNLIHLGKNSKNVISHHSNWRLKAIDKIKEAHEENLHYSSVISLSTEDFDWVRSKLTLLLEEIIEKVKESKDEKIAAFNFDWFEI